MFSDAGTLVNRSADLRGINSAFSTPLNKPNAHRLPELYKHSIPLFEHALSIASMAFETDYQSLKAVLNKQVLPRPIFQKFRALSGRLGADSVRSVKAGKIQKFPSVNSLPVNCEQYLSLKQRSCNKGKPHCRLGRFRCYGVPECAEILYP